MNKVALYINLITMGGIIILALLHFSLFIIKREKFNIMFSIIMTVAVLYIVGHFGNKSPSFFKSITSLSMTSTALLLFPFTIYVLLEIDVPRKFNFIYFIGFLELAKLIPLLCFVIFGTYSLYRKYCSNIFFIIGIINGVLFLGSTAYLLISQKKINSPIPYVIIAALTLIITSGGFVQLYDNYSLLRPLKGNHLFLFFAIFLLTISVFIRYYQQYDSKEAELLKKNDKLEKQEEGLRHINDELSTTNYALTLAKNKIEQQEREKTTFYTQLMHHLKTPICIIQEQLEASDEYKEDERLRIALDNAKQLRNALVNYLTVEAAVNRGESGYNHNLVSDISSITERVAGCFAGYSLKSEIEPGLKSKVDGEAFCQLVTCLLDNGFRHNGSDVEVEISLLKKDDRALLTVSDNGSGIHKESEPHIFKPFYQLANKRSNRQGIGMGLNHVKLIIDSVGGKIDVNNRVGEGVAFSLTFPLTTDKVTFDKPLELAVADLHDDKIEVSDSDYSTNRSSILIVDDNRGMLFTLKELFKDYNVFVAHNGREGLERLKILTEERKYISLILSDEMMDEMPGFDFIQAVREVESFKAIPFVFLTARTDFEDLLKGLSYKAVDYILKPFKREELKLRVASLIEQKETALNDYLDDENRQGDERILSYCRKKMLTDPQSNYILQLDLGLTPKEIALKYSTSEKSISHKSVESQIARGYKKLGLSKREELVKLLTEVRNGVLG